jgi:predicted SAM-dependent methyltransferase
MNKTFTRGSGLLESFLVKQRAKKANSLIKDIHRKGRILDIGCGFYPYFLANTSFKEKYGIDPSLILTNGINGIHLKASDITKQKFPFKENYFDTITMLAVFEHIEHEKLQFTLKEIKRILKINGTFILTTPASWSDKILHLMSEVNLISKEEIHEHKHNHSHEKIRDILIEAGFEKSKIKNGFFEAYMNMWFEITK